MRFRMVLAALLAAIPIEALGLFLLQYAPQAGAPQQQFTWLRLAAYIAALVHLPWGLLANFLCVRFCPPPMVQQIVIAVGGYIDVVLLMWFFYAVVQMWKPESRS